jgi:hypothetical protein
MSKEPSKTEQLRQMREARHSEQARPVPEIKKPARLDLQREIDALAASKTPAPEMKPAKPAPSVATKGKKRTAEIVGKTRQASRQGKVAVTVYVSLERHKQLRHAVVDCHCTIEEWVTTAIEMRLGLK